MCLACGGMTNLGLQESKPHAEAGAGALAEGLEGVPGGTLYKQANNPLKRGIYKMCGSRAAGGLLLLAEMVRVELLWVGVEPGQGKVLIDA